ASTAATEKLLENATSAATTAAGVEDFAEDVEGIVESTAASAGAARTGAAGLLEGGVTVAVVGGPFLRVLEDFVGLGDFFEHLLGLLVTGVFVRVILDGLLAVGFFELVFGRAFLDAEQFVVIGLSHGLEGWTKGGGQEAGVSAAAGPLETSTAAARRRRPLR